MDKPNYDGYRVETMTVHDVAALFRSLGMATTETKIADGIEQGMYPFGICIKQKGRVFEIYRRQVDEWLSDKLTKRSAS